MKVYSTFFKQLITLTSDVLSIRKSTSFLNYNIYHNMNVNNCETNNSVAMESLRPPSHVRGMTVLDKDKFRTPVKIPYVVIPAENMEKTLKILKPFLLKMRKLNPIIAENEDSRRILIDPQTFETFTVSKSKYSLLSDISNDWTNIDLEYDNWTSEDIFKAVLPEDSIGNVSSFSIIGHIIHLNLKPELFDFKYLIAQVLLDKYSNIKTVVNKCQTIDNEFRNFKMEHLAGECNYKVLVKENGLKYAFDFEKVFWNPRLSKEHDDMTRRFNSTDIVFDVFAGVGPFAVPMAKKGCEVHANDLNPDSYYWLCHNANLNKVEERLKSYNMDGKVFIQTVVKERLAEYFSSEVENKGIVQILMNLPALALTFLNSFKGLLHGQGIVLNEMHCMPVVHCYFFKRKDEKAHIVLRNYLNIDLFNASEITFVRNVAPNKIMMRVSFKLRESILFHDEDIGSEPSAKQPRLDLEH